MSLKPRAVLLCLLLLSASFLVARAANAHGMRTAYVEITALSDRAAWVHVNAASRVEITIDGCKREARSSVPSSSSAARVSCDGPLAGARVHVDGLGPVMSEAAVWITMPDGSTHSELATIAHPTFLLGEKSTAATMLEYVRLGLVHIATGADHLLFLAALALALRRVRAVLLAETAFTVSHTVSFTASALGFIHVSPLAAEVCIALSLVLAAREIAPRNPARVMQSREGAALAFVFGLVHGLGFAGGLAEVGLPAQAIPAALAGFAAGVELGQVAFLTLLMTALFCVRGVAWKRRVALTGTYAIGGAGAYLVINRVVTMLGLG